LLKERQKKKKIKVSERRRKRKRVEKDRREKSSEEGKVGLNSVGQYLIPWPSSSPLLKNTGSRRPSP
jgi:hypothetical protein